MAKQKSTYRLMAEILGVFVPKGPLSKETKDKIDAAALSATLGEHGGNQ